MKRKVKDDSENGFSEWGGYMEAKIKKLEEQYTSDSLNNPYKKSDLFAGISIYVNGLTNPSSDELKRIMMAHGGVYHNYQRSWTTYTIASNLPDVKIRQLTTEKVVRPEWIVDCLAAGKLLDYSSYLFYTESSRTSQPKISKFTGNREPERKSDEEILRSSLEILNRELKLRGKRESKLDSDKSKPNVARTAVDPNFLTEFYNNSRLHHISTLGAGFKSYIVELREKHTGSFPGRDRFIRNLSPSSNELKNNQKSIIMHIDMDCFFVSVGLRSRPHLRGLPVAVTHSKGSGGGAPTTRNVDRQKEFDLYGNRFGEKCSKTIGENDSLSEIASCSYEARSAGLKNGMFVGAALKLCPNLKTIPYDFEGYKEVAQTLYDTMAQYTLDIEPVSCDEMYVDLTGLINQIQSTGDLIGMFVSMVRDEIQTKTGCPCSAGIGQNRLQARMATKKAKPNGQFMLGEEMVEQYFQTISISDLPGVGYSTTSKLNQFGWKTCEDLQSIPLNRLQIEFGKKFGETLFQSCRGIDNKPLVYDQIRKSVSAEVNYGIRFTETHELDTFLKQLTGEVHCRLSEIKRRGKTITLKYMVRAKDAPIETAKFMGHGYCDHLTKSITLPYFTDDFEVIYRTITDIKQQLNIEPIELRGIGIQISKLDEKMKTVQSNTIKSMFEKVVKNQNDLQSERTPVKINRSKETVVSPKSLKKKSPDKGMQDISKMFSAIKPISPKQKPIDSKVVKKKPLKGLNRLKITEPIIDYTGIDLDFLAELPESIRKEVLRDHQLQIQANKRKELSKPKPSDVRIEEIPLQIEPKPIETNILLNSDWRIVLKSWIFSTIDPNPDDIKLISEFSVQLIKLKKLNHLYLMFRVLFRVINTEREQSCGWHNAYRMIVEAVQTEMLIRYEYRMRIESKFPNCTCSGTEISPI